MRAKVEEIFKNVRSGVFHCWGGDVDIQLNLEKVLKIVKNAKFKGLFILRRVDKKKLKNYSDNKIQKK